MDRSIRGSMREYNPAILHILFDNNFIAFLEQIYFSLKYFLSILFAKKYHRQMSFKFYLCHYHLQNNVLSPLTHGGKNLVAINFRPT